LWSLGIVLYEMIAGRLPFPGDYEQAVIYEILNQDPEPQVVIDDPQGGEERSVSPDGRYISYVSSRGAREEVFVASYPAGTDRQKISSGGGRYARWRGDDLYWIGPDGSLIGVEVETKGECRSQEEKVIATRFQLGVPLINTFDSLWDISQDGKMIVVLEDPVSTPTRAILLQNWLATLGFD
jgi:serine/threonine protein kinase